MFEHVADDLLRAYVMAAHHVLSAHIAIDIARAIVLIYNISFLVTHCDSYINLFEKILDHILNFKFFANLHIFI